MKAIVKQDLCIGCGSCVNAAKEVFYFNDEGYAETKNEELSEDEIIDVKDAMSFCPTDAIILNQK